MVILKRGCSSAALATPMDVALISSKNAIGITMISFFEFIFYSNNIHNKVIYKNNLKVSEHNYEDSD